MTDMYISLAMFVLFLCFFFFNDTATTEIYTLSLHDALPISYDPHFPQVCMDETSKQLVGETRTPLPAAPGRPVRIDYEYERQDRKSTRLNSSHANISYAVFCLKKKKHSSSTNTTSITILLHR